jgi:hypothetical protein
LARHAVPAHHALLARHALLVRHARPEASPLPAPPQPAAASAPAPSCGAPAPARRGTDPPTGPPQPWGSAISQRLTTRGRTHGQPRRSDSCRRQPVPAPPRSRNFRRSAAPTDADQPRLRGSSIPFRPSRQRAVPPASRQPFAAVCGPLRYLRSILASPGLAEPHPSGRPTHPGVPPTPRRRPVSPSAKQSRNIPIETQMRLTPRGPTLSSHPRVSPSNPKSRNGAYETPTRRPGAGPACPLAATAVRIAARSQQRRAPMQVEIEYCGM